MTQQEILALLTAPRSKRLRIHDENLDGLDLSGMDLSNIDFSGSSFAGAILDRADASGSSFEGCWLQNSSCVGTIFRGSNLRRASFRFSNLTRADVSGADLYAAVLENTQLDDVIFDADTRFYALYCPEEGPFIGFKKCFNDRLVALYIPKESQRTSATKNSCRTDRALVVSITSFDGDQSYTEATSLVDENFIYRKGQWVSAENFDPDRWNDSTGGIHFWLTREEAIGY